MIEGTVIYLKRSDLVKTLEHKEIEEIDLGMVKTTNRKEIEHASLVIFIEDTKYKILKSRYFSKEV
jgi:hypothetical protein